MISIIKTAFYSLFIMFFGLGFSQNKQIKGVILNVDNLPIENAAAVLYDIDKSIITYSVSDVNGNYELNFANLKTDYTLKITHIAYLPTEHNFSEVETKNNLINLNFTLDENKNTLDEVVVILSDKVKDTVQLNLERLKLIESDNLKEILGKIPNFKLSNDGSIIYKGKNINKILVNNKPSFVNQNSIALENIENKIIEGISVINNYTDDFTIDFKEDVESVLNIDTKSKSQSILNGSVEGKYGYNNKYELNTKGLYFSKIINSFLTSNTNNIGKAVITSNEIKQLFSKKQPISNYHEKSLSTLFSRNENLEKDFLNSTNITLRSQSKKLKTSGVLYYITPNRINSVVENTQTLDYAPLLNTKSQSKYKAHSFLGAFLIAYKINTKTILSYNLNANYINSKDKNKTVNQFFKAESPIKKSNSLSNNINSLFASYHQLILRSKLNKDVISETKAEYYNENSNLLNDYTINTLSNPVLNQQKFNFNKNILAGESSLKYNHSNVFIPSLTVGYKSTNERLIDKNKQNNLILNRNINEFNFFLKANGKNLFQKLNYALIIGVNAFENKLSNNALINKKIFIPIEAFINYESRLNRYYVEYTKRNTFNNLETGINTIQPTNSNWIGTSFFPLNTSILNNYTIGYNYDNLFDAELFSLSLGYSDTKNEIKKRFLKQEEGVTTFELFNAKKATNFNASIFYSKTVFPYKYPTKIGFDFRYNNDSYPILSNSKINDAKTNSFNPRINLETITDNLINFQFSANVSFIKDMIKNTAYNSTFVNNTLSILLKNDKWKGNLAFLLDRNRINNKNYTRKNINMQLSYTKNKTIFSIETRHLGELLSIFKNDAYNTQLVVNNGVVNTIINNQSLNYIILGIKYKL